MTSRLPLARPQPVAGEGSWAQRVLGLAHRHPRALLASVSTLLGSFAIAAFGIAPLTTDEPLQPSRVVSEAFAMPDLGAQREALAVLSTPWHLSTPTKPGDNLLNVLTRLGVTDPASLALARQDAQARSVIDGRAGRRVRAQLDSQGRLHRLSIALPARGGADSASRFTRAVIQRDGDSGWRTTFEDAPLVKGMRLASGVIRSSLFEATDAAQVPDAVAIQIAEIFSGEIDFHRELRRGDTFRVVYESLMADDEPVAWNAGSGRVLSVEFVNAGKRHEAVWFQPEGSSRGDYYDFGGNSRRRAFLASPLEFSRVTSGFAMRLHPIHKTWRKHLGVDYAAPTGTPVRSVGDGVVEFAGRQGGYGNVVIVKHSQQRSTVYAHLNQIDVRVGQSMSQGQRVGTVGATGWATGPHLHFEFRLQGEHRDPQQIARAAEVIPLPAQAKAAFAASTADHAKRLSLAADLSMALGQGE